SETLPLNEGRRRGDARILTVEHGESAVPRKADSPVAHAMGQRFSRTRNRSWVGGGRGRAKPGPTDRARGTRVRARAARRGARATRRERPRRAAGATEGVPEGARVGGRSPPGKLSGGSGAGWRRRGRRRRLRRRGAGRSIDRGPSGACGGSRSP